MGKKLKLAFSALILGLCLCVLVCTVLLPAAPLRGNETAVPAPKLMLSGKLNTEFLTELSDWYAQRFAFRSEAISMDSLLLANIFRTSSTDEVIVGKDGWLYYASTADDYCNARTLTDREIGNIAVTLSLFEEAAAREGMTFLFAAAPNKSTVYPEYMPENYMILQQDGNLERLHTALAGQGITYADLLSVLNTPGETLYHKTDSHWNNLGAATACKEILKILGRDCPDLTAEPYSLRNDFPGDLAAMLYPSLSVPEQQQEFSLPPVTETGAAEEVLYETHCEGGTGSLYCWRDSFGNALSPLLGTQFSSAVFTRSVPCDLRLAAEARADTLIWEIAERNIGNITLHAPIFEAPVRGIPVPAVATDTAVTAAVSETDGLIRITGQFDTAFADTGSRVYAVIDGIVYEATPAGGEDGCFTLYLAKDASADSLALILTENGVSVLTDTVQLSPAE